MNELREAAERVCRTNSLLSSWAAKEAAMVAEAWLAEHLPDDNEPVDWEWLQEQEDVRLAYPDLIVVQNPVLTIKIHCTMDGRSLDITRGQVRNLLRALGQQ
jgi:hypothetical protein